jgi:hypothetical protein
VKAQILFAAGVRPRRYRAFSLKKVDFPTNYKHLYLIPTSEVSLEI